MKLALKVIITISLVAISTPNALAQQSQPPTAAIGTYSVTLHLNESPRRGARAKIDVTISAHLPAGNDLHIVAIPFQVSPDTRPIVEPESSDVVVLFGSIPISGYGVYQFAGSAQDTKAVVTIRDLTVPLQRATQAKSDLALVINFKASEAEVVQHIPNARLLTLNQLKVFATSFHHSEPAAKSSDRYSRHGWNGADITDKVVMYLEVQLLYPLYFVLGGLGVFLGFSNGPRFITDRRPAILGLIVSCVGTFIVFLIWFFLLTPRQQFSETGIILTFGTVTGVLLAILAASIAHFVVVRTTDTGG